MFASFRFPSFRVLRWATIALLLAVGHARADEITPPILTEQTPAQWPGGKRLDHDVVVPVILTVGEDGTVKEVEVEISQDPDFDAAAEAAALTWKLIPAFHNGVAANARIRAVVRFRAVEEAPSGAPDTARVPPVATPPSPPIAPVELSSKPPEAQAPPQQPVEVVVAGRSQAPYRGASDYTIPIGELQHVPRRNASEMLKLAPGVHLVKEGGKGTPSASICGASMRERGWGRPRLRLYPPKLKVGLRASTPNEAWHVDVSIVRLLDGTRAYLHAVIDNFSRRILAWKVADHVDPMNTCRVLEEAACGLSDGAAAKTLEGYFAADGTALDEIRGGSHPKLGQTESTMVVACRLPEPAPALRPKDLIHRRDLIHN